MKQIFCSELLVQVDRTRPQSGNPELDAWWLRHLVELEVGRRIAKMDAYLKRFRPSSLMRLEA